MDVILSEEEEKEIRDFVATANLVGAKNPAMFGAMAVDTRKEVV